jgi:hypothetical protein
LVASDRNPGHRISLQGAWEPSGAAAHVWARSFGRPVDLPAGERVELVIVAPWPILESVTLNGRSVPWRSESADAAGMILARNDVTAELAGRNELRLHADIGAVEAEATSRRRGPLPDTVARVWLEIHGAFPTDHPGSQA